MLRNAFRLVPTAARAAFGVGPLLAKETLDTRETPFRLPCVREHAVV